MEVNDLIKKYGVTKAELSRRFQIPYKTIQNWTASTKEHRECPGYIVGMMDEILKQEKRGV